MTDTPAFTPEQIENAEKHPTLGTSYFAARDVAERYMKHFEAEQLEPLVKKIADAVRDAVWDDFRDYLLSDTELNIASEIRYTVDATVAELLGGYKRTNNKYALGSGMEAEMIRKAVAAHIPQELQDARIADLEQQVERLKSDLKFYRDR